MRTHRAAIALAVVTALTIVPVFGASSPDGWWEYLGEDGAVWVPATPPGPGATYLPPPDLGAFHNAEELGNALRALARVRPDLAKYDVVGTSVEGRDIHLLRVGWTDEPNSKPSVLYDGAHHGDEVIASEVLLLFAKELVNNYDTDPRIRALVDDVEFFIVPQVNPDGIEHVPECTYYADCRKNANGVDLNRNYESSWGQPGASPNPSDPTYRGPAPFSEPETTAIGALMEARAFSFYLSAHSGADMILWPPGNTTAPGPEQSIYENLGDRWTALTGSPNGQVPLILYGVSGDSMDHASFGLDGWRPLSTSPEVYRGSGSAYDWWYLFNPPDANIESVYQKWRPMFIDMGEIAAQYGPAHVDVPDLLVGGPDAFPLVATVTASPGRPLLHAWAEAHAHEDLVFTTPKHFSIGPVSGSAQASWTVRSDRADEFPVDLTFPLSWQGSLTASTVVQVEQATLRMTVPRTVLGAEESVRVPLTFEPGPFTSTTGTVTLTLDGPVEAEVASTALATEGPAFADFQMTFNTGDLPPGAYVLRAAYAFDGETANGPRSRVLDREVGVTIERPFLTIEKRYPPRVKAGEVFSVVTLVRNEGNAEATNVRVLDAFPVGYTFSPRTNSIAGALTSPPPSGADVEDGTPFLSYYGGELGPGRAFTVTYRLAGAVPGSYDLATRVSYEHDYRAHTADFENGKSHAQRVG